ncbi:acetoacetate--CoA ligase [Phytohabitans sp. ZYX-F-186]|uniref:Acetoacetate--CoA ligase n=1 Tax=Phytohabitans maris TaxID=3071409 RepID=A0ABU0ZV28_9ACTN|nr:acetoacetate--CoA ligase [Phytohabitans sp. ZYX-F-186]MDQ7910842.1 acetoacetate--CoA ligase [Phytohabitans sp. ZYX-F-186]
MEQLEPIWVPPDELVASANVTRFAERVSKSTGLVMDDYHALWQWSVADLDGFWQAVWEHFGLTAFGTAERALADDRMPGASWFPGVRLNFAEYLLGREVPGGDDAVAIVDAAENRPPVEITRGELRRGVAALAQALRGMGIQPGDVVAGYLPNIPQAVTAMLAAAAIGAIWSSVGQDYAPAAAVNRFGQLRPRVLIAADGYVFAGRVHRRTGAVREIRAGLPTVERVVMISRLDGADLDGDWLRWDGIPQPDGPLAYARVPFDHPLWVLFSSGTTGRPKGIVHGHGGILVETVKQMSLHWNLSGGDRVFWFTSPSWVMWNLQLSTLAVGAGVVCYDGSPTSPDPGRLWDLVAATGATFFGASPGYLQATANHGLAPAAAFDLAALRAMGSTGSPLPPALHRWAYERVGPLPLWSMSGGTDIAGAFLGGVPTVPIWPGQLSVRCLGVAAQAWTEEGAPVVDRVGELVVTRPMPSMPVAFWDDRTGERYREAYFSTFPGTWRHGDWISITPWGSCVVHGRSDSTLNRNGVRIGSAEIYAVVEAIDGVDEALVAGVELADGGYWMPLFVALSPGRELTDELRATVNDAVRTQASPRHVPDEIIQVSGIPHTRTGKKLEIPVKRLLQGAAVADVATPDAVDDPELLAQYAALARRGGARR